MQNNLKCPWCHNDLFEFSNFNHNLCTYQCRQCYIAFKGYSLNRFEIKFNKDLILTNFHIILNGSVKGQYIILNGDKKENAVYKQATSNKQQAVKLSIIVIL